ncbi:hypothetical protein B0I35DRAFT_494848 [Stachybotrys elegans]|uniref:Uncharacterized protein n=1 Tax=Stachybotrys elegans TaxID=80388 RepID=A0A8K0WKV0_9HYPO|nr:hypothetical protein B0I35DRAFT_494848 [Stachybotrys elegans]
MGYSKANVLGPGGGQYFALQFPTRFLDQQTFSYKLDGYLSRFNKPVAVNEAEFALTDALYPIAPIVGGTNGQSLSRNYSKALNSLIPTFESTAVRKQRERMRQWLLKDTMSGNAAYTMDTRLAIPGLSAESAKELSAATEEAMDTPRGMTRMEFSDALMQAYLNDRQEWETRKDKMIRDAEKEMETDPQAMDRLTRSLAHISALEEAKLAAKHGDAVVRGYSRTVRGFLGHLDIKSVAESLQDAKDSLRDSALSSLYTASSVYPVAMMPTDWFEALDTGFTREELSQDSDLIKAAIKAKAQLIDNLDNQIANLRGFNKGDPELAKKAMKEAAARRETAIAELSKKYTASTISAVKMALTAASGPAGVAAEAATMTVLSILEKPKEDKDKTSLLNIVGGEQGLKDIGKQIDDVAAANIAVNSASRALTEHMSEYSLAVAGDTQTMVEGLQRQLTNAKRELDELQESYMVAQRTTNGPVAELKDVGKLPSGNGGSRWSEVHILSSVSDEYTQSESKSSSSVKDFQCNFWIGSHSDSSSQSSASASAESASKTLNVDVSMRVTYVTVDRAGWFDPSLLAMSKSFMRGSDDNNYTPWATWNDGLKDEAVAEAIKQNGSDKPEGYLAAFPVGYILVKDCVIKVTCSGSDGKALKEHIDRKSQSSGGFLCFSHSSASSSLTNGSTSSTTSTKDGVVIRIPGPQILGYMMQVVDKDESQPFKMLEADEMFLDHLDEIDKQEKDKEDKKRKPEPSRSVVPGLGLGHKPQRTIRRYDDDDRSRSSGNDQPSGGSTAEKPARSILPPKPTDPVSGSGTGHLADALQLALNGREFNEWASTQPDDVRKEILKKLTETWKGFIESYYHDLSSP